MSMTENEAIERLRFHMKEPLSPFSLCLCKTAIQALEKQIPRKPIDKLMYLECPTCGDVGILDCGYCSACGQKLDWSE